MFERFTRDLNIFIYWLKRDAIRRWKLDTPIGLVGIIALITGITLLILIGQSFAAVFRAMIPWVAGNGVAEVYWSSIAFGIKVSLALLAFITSTLIYLFIRYKNRR